MARVIFSALLSAASGKIGDVVMSRWKGIPYVRRRVVPSNPQSGKQCLQRFVLKTALLLWQSIKAGAKPCWNDYVSAEPLSGYNQFMDECMTALIPQFTAGGVGVDPTWSTPAVTVGFPYNPLHAALLSVDAGTPETGGMAFTWTARAGCVATDLVLAWYRLDDASAWTAHAGVLESTETMTFAGLVNDSQYEFMLVATDDLVAYRSSLSVHKLATPAA